MKIQPQFASFFEQDVAVVQLAQVNTPVRNEKDNIQGLLTTSVPISLGIFGIFLIVWFLKSFLCICKPNEVVILSGRKRRTKDGQEVGYRVFTGGRAIRIPILETVKRMNVTTMPVRVEVHKAYSKGGTPLNIQAIANVKISSDPSVVGNAIERFLDHDRSEVVRVAQETLEGNLRGVVATLTPEQVNEDRLRFAERIASDVSRDSQNPKCL
jgi:flotillin